MRLCHTLLVSIILLSMMLQLVHIQTLHVNAEQVYPITIQNIIVNVEFTNVTIRIVLNSTVFNNWDLLQPDGSDVFFTDGQGNPLYYWIEDIDTVNKHAIIWVKIPDLPYGSNVTIYMHYGGSNPYRDMYGNPRNVFIYFERFDNTMNFNDTDLSLVTGVTPSIVEGQLVITGPGGDSYTAVNYTAISDVTTLGLSYVVYTDVKVTKLNNEVGSMYLAYVHNGTYAGRGVPVYGYGLHICAGSSVGDALVRYYNGSIILYTNTGSGIDNNTHVVTYGIQYAVLDSSSDNYKTGYKFYYYLDYNKVLTASTIDDSVVYKPVKAFALGVYGNATYTIDWIRVRVTPEVYNVYPGEGAPYNGTHVDSNSTTTNSTASDNVNNSTTSNDTTGTTTNTTSSMTNTSYYNTTSTVTTRSYSLSIREKLVLLLAGLFLLFILVLASRE